MNTQATNGANAMKSIFENYVAIIIGEKEIPFKMRRQGLTRDLLKRSLLMFASYGGSRPKQLLDLAIAGNADARKLLVNAACDGYARQAQIVLKSKLKELINA
ncbi:hypothetical protein [Leptolyngbya sp. FACHB-17]|uniref:hypothetical protein n=1 Tax=unclassified Leptolyngbya TaxID=2650499 RepID=UPI001680A447|nr:hypothetical protein [Leptolyngbya sp. FACHB-17]MBD2079587.1 hypothetical protein [Leptolyngbya sp. FACHB-17]